MKICLLGATSKTGRILVVRLCDRHHEVIAVGRDPTRLDRLDSRAARAIADLERAETIAPALAGAECVVSLAHARFTEIILAALPDTCRRVVLTGSTRKFTKLPDPAADAVRRGEAAFEASGRAGVMLHPSMIYGTPDDRNVNRILRLLRRWPGSLPVILPLPEGGRHRVQPVFVDDVVDAYEAAIAVDKAVGAPVVIAGPEAITYRNMIECCAEALGKNVWIVPMPLRLLRSFARAATVLGLKLPVDADELARAAEDKSFDVGPLRDRLGIDPRPFAEGLRLRLTREEG